MDIKPHSVDEARKLINNLRDSFGHNKLGTTQDRRHYVRGILDMMYILSLLSNESFKQLKAEYQIEP